MGQAHLEITYRHGAALAAYLRMPRAAGAKVAQTQEISETILADVDAEGRLLGLELLSPSSTTIAEVQAALAEFTVATVSDDDLRPLKAA